jgi:hypothetical protein
MEANAGSPTVNPLLTDDVRRYFASLRGGYRTFSKEMRVMYGRLNAGPGWATRRLKYGPSGQRDRSYKLWLEERGKQLPDELKV